MNALERANELANIDLSKPITVTRGKKPIQGFDVAKYYYKIGTKLHDWTVTGKLVVRDRGKSGKLKHEPYIPVICVCGHEQEVYYYALKTGKSKRCRECSRKSNNAQFNGAPV